MRLLARDSAPYYLLLPCCVGLAVWFTSSYSHKLWLSRHAKVILLSVSHRAQSTSCCSHILAIYKIHNFAARVATRLESSLRITGGVVSQSRVCKARLLTFYAFALFSITSSILSFHLLSKNRENILQAGIPFRMLFTHCCWFSSASLFLFTFCLSIARRALPRIVSLIRPIQCVP